MKWSTSKNCSNKSSAAWRPSFKAWEVSWGLSITAPKSSFSGVLRTVSFSFSNMRVRNFLFIIIFNTWEYWNFTNQHKDVPGLVLSNGELMEGVNCLRPKLFQQPFIAMDFSSSMDSFIFTIQSAVLHDFLSFTDTHKGLFRTCIKDNAEGVANKLCHDSLMYSCRSEVVVFDRFDRVWCLRLQTLVTNKDVFFWDLYWFVYSVSITYSEYMSVTLDIQHAMHMHRVT